MSVIDRAWVHSIAEISKRHIPLQEDSAVDQQVRGRVCLIVI